MISTASFAAATAPIEIAVTNPGVAMDFQRDVHPILKANCIACHNKTTTKADLNMETPELMRKGGESGAGIVPGRSAESIILQAAAHTWDSIMPPKGNKVGSVNLTPEELGVLKTWIDQGAKGSAKHAQDIAWQPLPPGLNPIYSVAMTKDGRFAACSRANQIFIHDLATRQVVTRLTDDALVKQEMYKGAGVAHRDLVQCLAFSPDGRQLASGSFREVKIWRHDPSKPVVRNADATLGSVVSRLSGDGRQLICGTKSGALHVMDATGGTLTRTIPNVSTTGIKFLSVSPDASRALVYGNDAALAIWRLSDGKRLAMKAGVSGVRAIVWTRDGKSVACAGEDKIVRVWSLPLSEDGELADAKELKGAAGAVRVLEAGTGPDNLLSAGEDNTVRLWSIAEGKVVREFKIAGVVSLALSADGKQLAAGCADGAVRVSDALVPKQIVELRGDLDSGRRMAALDWQISASAMDASFQTAEVARIDAEIKSLGDRLKKTQDAISAGNKALPEKQKAVKPAQDAKAAAQKVVDDVAALITKVPAGKPDAALEKQKKDADEKLMTAIKAEESAGSALATAENQIKDAEAELKIIDTAKVDNARLAATAKTENEKAKQLQTKAAADLAALKTAVAKNTAQPLAVAFSGDAQCVAASGSDGALRIWAVASGLPVNQIAGNAQSSAGSLVAADNGFFSCTPDGATARISLAARWVLERVLGGEKPDSPFVDRVNAVRFSPDGKSLAAGGGEPSRTGDIAILDVAAGTIVKSWRERHSDAVLSLDFSPDGKWIASGGADKAVRITDIASGKQTRVFEGHTHHVLGISYRADGRILASAGADNVVKIWDMLTGDRKKNIDGWDKEVTSVQFIGATDQLITSAGDNRVRIVRDSGAEVRSLSGLPDFMHGAAATATGGILIGGGQDGALRLWEATTGKDVIVFAAN